MSGRIYAQQRRAPQPARDADLAALSRPPASILQPSIPTVVVAPTSYAAPTLGYDFGQMTIQRCGATPCDCSPEERVAHALTESHEQEETKSAGSASGQRHVHRHAEEGGAAPNGHAANVEGVLGASGQPLDGGTRAFMESRFGHDFSRVRIHTDTQAALSARSLNALAYTVGRDIVFGAGHYAPQSTEGRRLIAHELTHVVQQEAGPVRGRPVAPKLAVSDPADEHERAADAMAQRVLHNATASAAAILSAQRQIQRDTDDDATPAPSGPSTTSTPGTPTNLADPNQQPVELKGGQAATGSTTIQPPTQQVTVYHGKTLSEVDSQMPTEVGSLEFELNVGSTGDPITSANLTVAQVMTLPQWAEHDQQCQPVQAAWDSFMAALRNHENGHTAIDNRLFASAHQRYIGKAAGDTQTVSDTITAEVQAAQNKYDADTDHGRKQTPSTTLDTTVTCPPPSKADASETAPANAVASAETSEGDTLQTKLAVSVPGDPYELEADRMADAVMAVSDFAGPGRAATAAAAPLATQSVSGMIQRDDPPGQKSPDTQAQEWIDGTNISDAKSDILDNKINLGSVDPQRRMNLVNMFFNQTWVGPRDESAIKAILTSLGDGLPDIVNKGNIGIWNTSLDRAKGAVHDLPVVWHESRHFEDAIVARADSYLENNTDYALAEKKRYGLGDDAAHPTAQQDEAVKAMQEAAKRVAPWVDRQAKLESMRVGKKIGSVSRAGTFYEPVQFKDALEAPPPERVEGEAPWQDVKKHHTEALDAIQAITANFPGVYAIARDGKSAVDAMGGATKENARALMNDALSKLLTNIVMTKLRLHDPTSDLKLKLKPIYDQFKKSEDPWNKPFGASIVDDEVKGKGDDFWSDLGLKGLEAALFVVVTMATGGWGAVVLTAIQEGVNVTQKWEEYNAMQQAQGTNLTPGTALVTNGQVNFALMDAMEASANAFIQVFLAAIPGEEAAAKAVDAEAAKKTLQEAEGQEAKLATEAIAAKEADLAAHAEERATEIVAEVPAANGHKVVATADGELRLCSDPPCSILRARWQQQLDRDPALKAEFEALEKEEKALAGTPKSAAHDAHAAQAAAIQTRLEEETRKHLLTLPGMTPDKLEALMWEPGMEVWRLEKLMSPAGMTVARLEGLLGKQGMDAVLLEKLLSKTSNDLALLDDLLALVPNSITTPTKLHDFIDVLGPNSVKELAPALKDAGLEELQQLQMFKLDPAKQALLDSKQGAAVRALPPLDGRAAAEIEADLTAAGFTQVADDRGQHFWMHPDGSLVRLKLSGEALSPLRPTAHAVKEISKTAGDYSNKAVFAKVADNGAILPQGTKSAQEQMRQWFKKKVGRDPTPVESGALMNVWADSGHVDIEP